MRAWKVILAALVIFVAGVLTGGLANQLRLKSARPAHPPPGAPPMRWWSQQRNDFLERLDRHLDLTIEQRTRIEQILKESQTRMKELWEPMAPKAHEEFRQTREKILNELTPEQRKLYEEIFKSHSRRPGDNNSPDRRRR